MLFTVSLTSNKDFTRLYKSGRSFVTPAFVCYYRENGRPYNRVGITASKKLGNAVCRNRARRLLREAYRQNELAFPIGRDIVFVARSGALASGSETIGRLMSKRLVSAMDMPSPAKGASKAAPPKRSGGEGT